MRDNFHHWLLANRTYQAESYRRDKIAGVIPDDDMLRLKTIGARSPEEQTPRGSTRTSRQRKGRGGPILFLVLPSLLLLLNLNCLFHLISLPLCLFIILFNAAFSFVRSPFLLLELNKTPVHMMHVS